MSGLTNEQVVLSPVVSEKSYSGIADRRYTFKVHPEAHKTQVRQAVEELFDVHVERVNIVKVQSKPKVRGRFKGTRPGWKKAIVQVREGETIEIFEEPRSDGSQEVQAHERRPSPDGNLLVRGDHAHRAGEVAARAAQEVWRPEQQRSHHHAPSGRGHKRRYRRIDFKRVKDGVPAKVASIEYDPNRSARIALLHYADGAKAYILAPVGLRVGATVQAGPDADIKPGNALPLGDIPTGTVVHAVELKPGQGAKLARSAGSGIQLVAKDAPYGVLRLPSGEMRRVLLTCRATVGQVGNADHANEASGKAGRSRWLGKRPSVRGTAMNPVDHPHGGGEGKSKGHHPVTPWGVPTIGKRTRPKHKESDKLIVRGRRRGKERR